MTKGTSYLRPRAVHGWVQPKSRIGSAAMAWGLFAAIVMWLFPASAVWAEEQRYPLDIPSTSADIALKRLARQTGYAVIFQSDEVASEETTALAGQYTVERALESMLGSTDLAYGLTEGRVITITRSGLKPAEGAVVMTQKTQKNKPGIPFFKRFAAVLAGALTATTGTTALSEEGLVLEEVIVTAQKREQNLKDVPIAISVVSGDDVEAAGFTTLSSLTRAVPNLTYNEPTAPLFADYALRGLSTTGNNTGVDPGVGVYVDGVYLGRGIAFDGVLMDIERVEVLKGPQGTIFGKNTAIGAISIVTKKPSEETSGMVELNGGNYDRRQARAVINGPLVEDKLFGKLAVNSLKRDGYIENTTGGDLNDEDTMGARAQLLWRGSDSFEALLTVEGSKDRTIGNYTPVTADNNLTSNDFTYDISIPQDTLGTSDRDLYAASLQMDYDMDNYSFTSITSFRGADSYFSTDQDYSLLDALFVERREDQTQFSQELRVVTNNEGPLNWIAGLYYFDQDVDSESIATISADFLFAAFGIVPLVGSGLCPEVLGPLPGLGIVPCNLFVDVQADIKSTTTAAYFSLTYDITDNLSFTGGLRYTREKKELDYSQSSDNPLWATIFEFPPIAPFSDSFSDTEPSGDLSLVYKFNEDVSTYAKVSHGFKAGGYNATLSSSVSQISFEPEFIDSFEVGLKSSLFDNRMNLNIAVFHMEFKDKQEQQFVPGVGFRQTNAGEATSQGFEVELVALPAQGWDLAASLGYADATYDSFLTGTFDANGNPIDFAGNHLVAAPEITANVSSQYRFSAFDWADLMVRAEVSHQSSVFSNQENTKEFETGDLTLVSARIGLISSDDSWSLTLWGDNLFEEEVFVFASPHNIPWPGRIFQPNNPRTYGLEARYRF